MPAVSTDQCDHHLVVMIEEELIRDDGGIASFDLVVHALAGLDLGEVPVSAAQRRGADTRDESEDRGTDGRSSMLLSSLLCCLSDQVMMNGPVDVEMNVSCPSPTLKCAGVKSSELMLCATMSDGSNCNWHTQQGDRAKETAEDVSLRASMMRPFSLLAHPSPSSDLNRRVGFVGDALRESTLDLSLDHRRDHEQVV